jgi:hypothetical protein
MDLSRGRAATTEHEENNEMDLRAVAVVKDSIAVGFKYCRRLIWHEQYSLGMTTY